MKRPAILVGVLLLAAAAARAGQAALEGVVVRAEGRTLYFDLGRDSGIRTGDGFEVFEEGAELRHPETGRSLGPILKKKASGAVDSVEEKYSTGLTDAEADPAWVRLKVRVLREAAPEPRETAAGPAAAHGRQAAARSPLVRLRAVDLAAGDLDGDGSPEIVLAGEKEARAYPSDTASDRWEPVCVYKNGTTGARAVSVEAADLDGDGRDEVFLSFFNSVLKQGETVVLSCEEGVFREKASLPWLVRSFGTQEEGRALAVQQVEDDRNFPLTGPFTLEYDAGRYRRSRKALRPRGVEWIYAFSLARGEDGPLLIDENSAGRLRVRSKKGSRFRRNVWTSSEAFGQTAERVEWQGETLRFRPAFFTGTDAGGKLEGIYLLRNIPRMLGLASAFGIFNRSELHHLRWNGLGFEASWTAELQGYAAGLAELPARGSRPARLAVAVVGGSGSTSVWTFDR